VRVGRCRFGKKKILSLSAAVFYGDAFYVFNIETLHADNLNRKDSAYKEDPACVSNDFMHSFHVSAMQWEKTTM
jgi:hypothetical protein